MSDVRFKISGDSAPFLVNLWNSNCSTNITKRVVDYSGTCVIFYDLSPTTCYNVNVIDSIGKSISKGYTTPVALTPPAPPTKYASMLGSLSSTGIPNYTQQLTAPKYVCFDPPLIDGECVDLTFNIETCNTSKTLNSVAIICNDSLKVSHTNNQTISTYSLNMKYGDTVCYTMSSVSILSGAEVLDGDEPLVLVDVCGLSQLTLTNVVGYNFNAAFGSGSVTTKKTCLSYPKSEPMFNITPDSLTIASNDLTEHDIIITSIPSYWSVVNISSPDLRIVPLVNSVGLTERGVKVAFNTQNITNQPNVVQVTFMQGQTIPLSFLTFFVTQEAAPSLLQFFASPNTLNLLSNDVATHNISVTSQYGWFVESVGDTFAVTVTPPINTNIGSGTNTMTIKFNFINSSSIDKVVTIRIKELITNKIIDIVARQF